MGSFEILSHTADVGFRARGASLADLFETAAKAMFSLEYDLSTVAFEREVMTGAEADDLEELLYAWLSDLLFLHDAEGFAAGDFVVTEIGEPPTQRVGAPALIVRAAMRGRVVGDWFQQTGPQLKAVTMHGLEIRERRGRFEASVFVDV
ncbi:MAG: archease [Actinomycetota bacterium]